MQSTDIITKKKVMEAAVIKNNKIKELPRQITPFPTKPSLQVQVNDPSLLKQSAFLSQGFPFFVHSSTSGTKYRIDQYLFYIRVNVPINWIHIINSTKEEQYDNLH